MSDVMMFGIARMPYEMAMDDELSRLQFYQNTQRLAAALEAAREDAWIACSDRLPERDGLGAVLAFDAARPRKGVWLETTHPSWWGQFMQDANEWGPTITHWRPLPAPPAIDQARGKCDGEVG